MQPVDLYLTYQFLKKLTTPFNKWDAYKLGIIDAHGNQLKLIKDLKTSKEKQAFGYFDLLILNLKKLLSKVGADSKIATYAAALLLLKQHQKIVDEDYQLIYDLPTIVEQYIVEAQVLIEDGVAANAVGSGAIAGTGVGPAGEPGFTPAVMKHYKQSNQRDAKKLDINSVRRVMKGNLK